MWIFATVSFVALTVFAFTWDWHPKYPTQFTPPAAKPASKPFRAPTTLDELANMTPAQLDHCDIALMNLLCTQGLPGAENVNIPQMLATLDEWATHVKAETDRNMHRFYDNPKNFNNSEAYFRMFFFVTVMQEDYGVHYNPALMDPSVPAEVFFADSRNVFIHGLIGPERTGTCSSMPVLYVAIARRLGYPLYLAMAKEHLLTQWDDGKERFNVEGTSWGFSDHDNDFYRKWPEPITDDEMKENRYLRPLSGSEELSVFLQNRGGMLAELFRDYKTALACFERAHALTPTWPDTALTTKQLERIVADPSLLAPDPSDIERESEEYRRTHGHYTPPLPAEIVAADPMLGLSDNASPMEVERVAMLINQKEMHLPSLPSMPDPYSKLLPNMENLPKEVRDRINLPVAPASQQWAGYITPPLPNGTVVPMSSPNLADLKQSAIDHWPNPPPGLQLPWLNPRPIR